MGNNNPTREDWREAYRAALLEQDVAKLAQRISDARLAIIERIEATLRHPLNTEHQALYSALKGLRTLCEQTHTSIEWLVTGRGRREAVHTLETPPPSYENQPNRPPLNYTLLEAIMDAIDVEVSKDALDLPSPKRSMLVVTLYDMFQDSQRVDSEAVSRLVKLAR